MKGPQPLHNEIRSSDMSGIRAERARRAKQRSEDRDSKEALARLLGSPGRKEAQGQRPGVGSAKYHNTHMGVFFICPRQLPTLPGGLSQCTSVLG